MSQKDSLKTKILKLIKKNNEDENVLADSILDAIEEHESELKKAVSDKISNFNKYAKEPRNQNDISQKMIKGTLAELEHLNQTTEFENLK